MDLKKFLVSMMLVCLSLAGLVSGGMILGIGFYLQETVLKLLGISAIALTIALVFFLGRKVFKKKGEGQ